MPEFYKHRNIIWHDEDREFEDRISEITLTDAKIVALTDAIYEIEVVKNSWSRSELKRQFNDAVYDVVDSYRSLLEKVMR